LRIAWEAIRPGTPTRGDGAGATDPANLPHYENAAGAHAATP
jgi:hypothetical protein